MLKNMNYNIREDPSNESDAYMRNRFRHHIVPFILDENPAAAENVVKMTGYLQEDEELLEMLAKERFEEIITFTEEGLPSLTVMHFPACTCFTKADDYTTIKVSLRWGKYTRRIQFCTY